MDLETLNNDYFTGEWCLVRSTRDDEQRKPNINYRIGATTTLALETESGSGKFAAGSWSWKPEVSLFMLKTLSFMQMAKVESATENGFVLGSKIGYTFERGVCDSK